VQCKWKISERQSV